MSFSPPILRNLRSKILKPDAAVYETFDRELISNTASTPASGTLRMVGIALPSGLTIAGAAFVSGSTPLSGGSHGWYSLHDASRALLRQSTDDTSPVFAANVPKPYNFSSQYVTTYEGLYYLGILFVASQMPNLLSLNTLATGLGLVPIIGGNSTASLTGTAPDPAAAITASSQPPYAYVF